MARDRALDPPPLVIVAAGKAPFHLTRVACLRPALPGVAAVEDGHGQLDAKVLVRQDMAVFPIEAGVTQQAHDRQRAAGLGYSIGESWRVLARALTDYRCRKQVCDGVADQREVGPPALPQSPVPLTVHEVGRSMATLQASRVDRAFGAGFDQAAGRSRGKDRCQ